MFRLLLLSCLSAAKCFQARRKDHKGGYAMSKHDDQDQPAKGKVQVGDLAPDFILPDQSGTPVGLGDFLGKTDIVLYFYPRDNTGICTQEAGAFRDNYQVFKDAG